MSSTTQKPLVFVTGASGLLGYAIVYQLLEAGFPVRGSARGKKVELLKKALSSYPNFEAVEIADIAAGDYSDIFKGVDAIIHTAAPLPGATDKETAFRSAIDGSLHVLKQADKAGITKIVTTSSVVTYPLPGGPFTPETFLPLTKEQAFASDHPGLIYFAEKKYADLAVLDFAKGHPHITITMIAPPFIYGPLAPGFEYLASEPGTTSLSTNSHIYALITSNDDKGIPVTLPGYVDLRDVARAHILAINPNLETPQSTGKAVPNANRLAVLSPYSNNTHDTLQILSSSRPELKTRLIDEKEAPNQLDGKPVEGIEYWRLEEVIGFKKDEFRTWKETVLDTVDSLVRLEQSWKNKGFKL
ncbi:NAD(P)-binding protein [Dendrothele bispora CBS 962.96]|uniref:NAD(P)-binding protein n=1 Tax=Dendrothele bispora (strain CBS 962.96) TaxID=1314807 RepID=A0A4S8KLW8_DENBC|nr:NAD(P)-binding protein [Dendrothele bispora CBS 962.96]